MFTVRYGVEKREHKILSFMADDPVTAVILAAVHFEWMLKRTILVLGITPTRKLRAQLELVYRLDDKSSNRNVPTYKSVWNVEIMNGSRRNASLGRVLGNLHHLQGHAMKVRGRIIHGNGVVNRSDAMRAVQMFIESGRKLSLFVKSHGKSLDSKLVIRRKTIRQ